MAGGDTRRQSASSKGDRVLSHRLDSWKGIAEHLGRDVRTVIRWERDRGLPVHRVPGGRRSAVFGYCEEIDRWLAGQELAGERSEAALPSEPEPTGSPRLRPWPVGRAFGLAALVLAVLASGSHALRGRNHGTIPPASAGRIARLEFGARDLTAWTEAGGLAWRHQLERPLHHHPWHGMPRSAIADLDGDGVEEVLASVTTQAPGTGNRDDLICFGRDGHARWSRRSTDAMTFRGGSYEPPFWDGNLAVYRLGSEVRIAWSQNHHVWWPSRVDVLDARGRTLQSFVHAGHINALSVVDGPEGPLLLAGGVSNAHRAAMLAVLDGRDISGSGPVPPDTPFECDGCPAGRPIRYFLFPPSEINRARGLPYNWVQLVNWVGGGLHVYTIEAYPEEAATSIFRFSPDLTLRHAAASDSWTLHDRLFKEGRLDHTAKDCSMYRVAPPVRMWAPSSGWADVHPSDGPPTGRLARR